MEKFKEKEKSSKGLSLRRKRTKDKQKPRPVIGAPRQIPMPAMPGARVGQTTGPMNAPPPPQAVRNLRDKEKVADMVKRRMSTRFTMIPDGADGDAPPMPNMPPMPVPGLGLPAALQAGGAGGKGGMIDTSPFRDPAFDPDKFVSKVLESASPQQIEEYQRGLADARTRSQNEMQKNIYINRTQFVITAKEVDKVKTEMRALRANITDLRNTTNSLKTDNSYSNAASDSASIKRSNRSSVADLTALHMSHLQALWKEVEGAQKFLPSVPGRHIVVESRNWIELNAATWKPRRIVHLVLLNDHLLVATVKKKRTADNSQNNSRNAPAQIKNVAERCWPLSDIDMVDIDSSRKGVTNAISLRIGKESFVYQNDDNRKKQELLRQFKKSSDELRKAMRAENEDSMRRRDSVHFLTGRDPLLLEHGDLLNSLSTHGAGASLFVVEGQTRNLRWVESKLDELDEHIAHRKFDDAVAEVVDMRNIANGLVKSNTVVGELIGLKLDERASKLAGIITADLVEDTASKTKVKQNVAWLKKLDYEDRAREAYLQARSDGIRKMTRRIQFEGDVSFYISQVALVQFVSIKNTAEIYNSCFDSQLSSALVRWAWGHIESYMELLNRQLEVVEVNSKAYSDCMEITKIHSAQLVDAGFDFKPLRKPAQYIKEKRATAAVVGGVGPGLKQVEVR